MIPFLAATFSFCFATLALANLPIPPASVPTNPTPPTPTTPTPKISFAQCRVDGPYVALTFDDGPHATNTPRLLEMLRQRKIHATFFMVGQCVNELPEIVKKIVADGHEVANHSWSHPQLSSMTDSSVHDQIQKTHDAIIAASGVTPKIFRPPYGAFTARQRAIAHAAWGYRCILWDVDPLDWKVRNAEYVKNAILKATVSGSIILTHDIHKTTVDAMPETIDALLAKGFKFVTVSELLAMDNPLPPQPKAPPTPKSDPSHPHGDSAPIALPTPSPSPKP